MSAIALHGPVDDESIQADISREEVEKILGRRYHSMFRKPDGLYEAQYDYIDGPSAWSKLRVLLYLGGDVITFGLAELIFWPAEMQIEKRAARTGLAEYSQDFLLASWEVTRKSGAVLASLRSSKYESYALASQYPSRANGARFARSGGTDDDPPLLAPATATTQTAHVRFKVGLRDTSQYVGLLVDGQAVQTAPDGTLMLEKVVPMGESTIELTALDINGGEHVQLVSVTRWDPSSRVPSSLLAGSHYALVIGNDAYTSLPPLRTARADALDIAGELKGHYGYEVEVLLDATRHDIVRALASYRNLLTSDDRLLVYYAGHGIEDKIESHGYWLPVDAEIDNPSEWIANASITRQIKAMNAKHVMVIADSCYSGTLTRGIAVPDRAPGYLERLAGRRSRTVMTSGGIEPVADAGTGSNSVFAEALLYELRANQGLLEANELFLRVRRQVAENADQTPQYAPISKAGHGDGEFLFYVRDNSAN